jgi:hypothetical protein
MAEIKSTLDLVMEKTKHLNLSRKERRQLESVEIEKRIKGLLQKFQDQTLSRQQLKTEYADFKKDYNLSDDSIFISEILDRLVPGRDNRELLVILNEFCGANPAGLESVLNDYQDALDSASSYRIVKIRENLARKHNISGPAVVPNLEADAEWPAEARDIRATFQEELDREKAKLLDEK